MILPFSAYLIKSAALLGRARFSKNQEKSIVQEAEKEVRSSIKQSCTVLLECKIKSLFIPFVPSTMNSGA